MHSKPQRTIAIGDIHGCFLALDSLLEAIDPQPEDQIVVLGDFIDQGRETKQAIERLLLLETQCQLVHLMGNHEEVFLSTLDDPTSLDYWMQCGGSSTLNSYRFGGSLSDIPDHHIEFIRRAKDFHETNDVIFCHATPESDRPMKENSEYGLRWQLLDPKLAERHMSGKTAFVGHTEQRSGEVLDLGFICCIDTACWRYGWLTAIDVETREIWQAQRFGPMREQTEPAVGPLGGSPIRVG